MGIFILKYNLNNIYSLLIINLVNILYNFFNLKSTILIFFNMINSLIL